MKAMEILTREEARSSPLSLSQRQAGPGQKIMPQKRLLLAERAENNDQVRELNRWYSEDRRKAASENARNNGLGK